MNVGWPAIQSWICNRSRGQAGRQPDESLLNDPPSCRSRLRHPMVPVSPHSHGMIEHSGPCKLPSELRNPITGIVCCACAASGHAAAAPPRAASNSRRPMVTVIRPSRARCVKATVPRHQRAVFTFRGHRMLPPFTGDHKLRTSQSSVRDHDSSVLPRMSALMAAMVAPERDGVTSNCAAVVGPVQ
jgi:hypothetical protein